MSNSGRRWRHSPNSCVFFNSDVLQSLFEYAESIPVVRDYFLKHNLSIQDLNTECRIFSRVFKVKQWPKVENEKVDLVDVAAIIKTDHENSAPVLTSLYVTITAGYTSTQVECLFSSLSRVDTPKRQSMKTGRECNLAFPAFENKILIDDITFDDFLHAWKLSPRKFFNV